ncbi:MAG: hypothetical protein OEN01_01010 [Candidatus Krumholzibacteria bacterium]|nr:hypothetical protein [Candidatus Krumholzibacteria bacterium]
MSRIQFTSLCLMLIACPGILGALGCNNTQSPTGPESALWAPKAMEAEKLCPTVQEAVDEIRAVILQSCGTEEDQENYGLYHACRIHTIKAELGKLRKCFKDSQLDQILDQLGVVSGTGNSKLRRHEIE